MAFDFWIFKFLDCCRSINNGGTSEDLKTTHPTHPWRVLWAAYVQETTAWGDFVCASHAPMLVHTKVACCWAKAANGGNAKGRGRCKRRSCAHLPAVQFTGSCIDCCMLCVCVCVFTPLPPTHTSLTAHPFASLMGNLSIPDDGGMLELHIRNEGRDVFGVAGGWEMCLTQTLFNWKVKEVMGNSQTIIRD